MFTLSVMKLGRWIVPPADTSMRGHIAKCRSFALSCVWKPYILFLYIVRLVCPFQPLMQPKARLNLNLNFPQPRLSQFSQRTIYNWPLRIQLRISTPSTQCQSSPTPSLATAHWRLRNSPSWSLLCRWLPAPLFLCPQCHTKQPKDSHCSGGG